MKDKKTYTVVVTTGVDNHECHLEMFYCEMMAINYIEREYYEDVMHGEDGQYKYLINGERYI